MGRTSSQIVDAPDRTYMLAGGHLMSLSADGSETYYYNSSNKLSDSGIDNIKYNYDKGYLLIAYTNGNIDLLYDDGSVANMPDLKVATLSTSHSINHIDFKDGRILVATDFGIVIYNDERHEVIESGIYNQKVAYAFIMGDKLVILTNNELLWSPTSTRHASLSSFKSVKNTSGSPVKLWPSTMVKLNDAELMVVPDNMAGYFYTIDDEGISSSMWDPQNPKFESKAAILSAATIYGKDCINITTPNTIYTVTDNHKIVKTEIPEELRGQSAYSTDGITSVWVDNNGSFSHYNLATDKPTQLMEPLLPNAVAVNRPMYFDWSADGERLYISQSSASTVKDQTENLPLIFSIKDSNDDFTSFSVPSIGRSYCIGIDPDEEHFYAGYFWRGFGVFKDEQEVQTFDTINSGLSSKDDVLTTNRFAFDREGNLWVGVFNHPSRLNGYSVLPAAKVKARDWASIKKSDWLVPKLPDSYKTHHDNFILFHRRKNYIIMANSQSESGLLVINHNGTLTDFSDDIIFHTPKLIDQSGTSTQYAGVTALVEDQNGKVWVGTAEGILVMNDPAAALTSGYTLIRPLVARNDGTNYGDYLLSTDYITDIAVDHTNRKWVATKASGVYLVSEDGSKIIEHFNTDNSPLASNAVYAVTVDPHSAKIYFGTNDGVFVYNGTATPPADTYSDVLVYPNPVRPEYSGPVTVEGLMDNSLVKITDAAGNVIYTTRSEGGSMTWNVCNAAGKRVCSGVYFIMASQNSNGSTGVVAKVMVIN